MNHMSCQQLAIESLWMIDNFSRQIPRGLSTFYISGLADIFYFDLQIVLSNKTVVFEKTLSIFGSKCKSCEISVPGFESQTFV